MRAIAPAGGVGTLCHSLAGKVQKCVPRGHNLTVTRCFANCRLDYKTLRYPGHLNYIRFLMHGALRVSERYV